MYIATVAEKGAGKGLFVEILKKLLSDRRIVVVRFSDPLREIVALLGKEESRDNIDTVVTALRNAFHDDGILIPAIRKRLNQLDADIVILDGLRKPEEISLVREHNGVLLYITADQRTRFERRRQSAETTDEIGMNWEQFVRQDQAAVHTSIQNIGETMADVRIENNGTVEEFEAAIKKFLDDKNIS